MSELRYFVPYVRNHMKWIILALVLMIGDVLAATLLPWYMSDIVDRGVLAGDISFIRRVGIQMAVISLLGSLFAFCFSVVASILSQRISNQMRKDLFHQIHSLSYGQTDSYSPGVLVTRIMSDTQIVTQFGIAFLQMLLKPAALFLFGFVMTLIISDRFAIVFAIAIPLQTVLMIVFVKKMTPLFTRIQLRFEALNSRIQETLGNLRLIKSYVQQDYEYQKFKKDNENLLGLNLQIQNLLAIMNPLIMLIINLALIGILHVGSMLVQSHSAEVGQIIAAIMYVQQIMMSLMMIGQIYQVTAKARVSCGRLQEIAGLKPQLKDGTRELDGPIQTITGQNVSYSYPASPEGSPPVLNQISFSIPRGSFIALTGPTGSGKSTLLSLLARFILPCTGVLQANGIPIQDLTERSLRERVILVPQHSALRSGTIRDNICYGLNASDDEIRQAAVIAQADRFISALPEGYQTPVSQRGASLSGGQKQCITIARALLRKPEVLILDDSTSSMDLMTEKLFRDALRVAFPEMILIMVSQRIAPIISADQILLIDHGEISARGSHGELLEQSELYREMYMSQQAGGDVA